MNKQNPSPSASPVEDTDFYDTYYDLVPQDVDYIDPRD